MLLSNKATPPSYLNYVNLNQASVSMSNMGALRCTVPEKINEIERMLISLGFEQVRQVGSHITWRHIELNKSLTIKLNGKKLDQILRIRLQKDLKKILGKTHA